MNREIKFNVAIEIYKKYKVVCEICTLGFDQKQYVCVETSKLLKELEIYKLSDKDIENILQDFEQQEDFCTFDSDDYFAIFQSSGLLDKNDKKIFEGDILKLYFGQIVIVKFIDGCFQYWLNEKSLKPFDKTENMNLSVIGNIFMNPELLK